jgi:D-alanine-D-alanine ligase
MTDQERTEGLQLEVFIRLFNEQYKTDFLIRSPGPQNSITDRSAISSTRKWPEMILQLKDLKERDKKPFTEKRKFDSQKRIDITSALRKMKGFSFVFIAMHGAFGEDGRIQALLEWIGVPYSGSGFLSSAMAMDKEISNEFYKKIELRVPHFVVLEKNLKNKTLNIKIPVVVKPANGGSSVGISIVKVRSDLPRALTRAFKEGRRIMIQEYIEGREFTCGVLEDKQGKAFALPPTEIIPKASDFFDYKAKYKIGGSLEITPARLSKALTKNIQAMALKAHNSLGCNGMSRSDFILKGSKFYILETNTIPGMTQTSLLPQAAKVADIDFPTMLDLIIAAGLRRK